MAEVLLLYLLNYLEKLLAKTVLGLRHLAHPFQMILGETQLIIVSVLLVSEDAVVLLILILEHLLTPLVGHVKGFLVPRQPIMSFFKGTLMVVCKLNIKNIIIFLRGNNIHIDLIDL